MSLSAFKYERQDNNGIIDFWSKVEAIYGEIPILIKLVLGFNGFDSFLALRGINWNDRQEFFDSIEDSVRSLQFEDETDELRLQFEHALRSHHMQISNFKLRIGHKNFIINLCQELTNTSVEKFNGKSNNSNSTTRSSPKKDIKQEQDNSVVITSNKLVTQSRPLTPPMTRIEFVPATPKEIQEAHEMHNDNDEMVQYVYEEDEDEEEHVIYFKDDSDHEQEYLCEEDEVVEMVIQEEDTPHDDMENHNENYHISEQFVKSERSDSDNSRVFVAEEYREHRPAGSKRQRPRHMYSQEYLEHFEKNGAIGTIGRRRPKLQRYYPNTEEGLLRRWKDLVRQSCQVIVPSEILRKHNLQHITIVKLKENMWEVKCPLCMKKVKLQLTQEGKYVNYKRSNFERHLRIVHYRQIQKVDSGS